MCHNNSSSFLKPQTRRVAGKDLKLRCALCLTFASRSPIVFNLLIRLLQPPMMWTLPVSLLLCARLPNNIISILILACHHTCLNPLKSDSMGVTFLRGRGRFGPVQPSSRTIVAHLPTELKIVLKVSRKTFQELLEIPVRNQLIITSRNNGCRSKVQRSKLLMNVCCMCSL